MLGRTRIQIAHDRHALLDGVSDLEQGPRIKLVKKRQHRRGGVEALQVSLRNLGTAEAYIMEWREGLASKLLEGSASKFREPLLC